MTAYMIRGTVSEDDVYALVQRYGASTVFTLLQEISQATEKDVKIDWKALVKATSTGISNAREYQMLWRHLAYKDSLDKVEAGGEPLSDESDLECELEATPIPTKEVLSEVDCCVKVLLSSDALGDCGPLVAPNIEALPSTDIANDLASAVPLDKQNLSRYSRLTSTSVQLSQKQQSSIEGLNGNGSLKYMFPAKKKRKLWSKEEDMELIAAVDKFGEGNWANILKGDFKHDRTASQLSQRWAIIRKRQTSSKQSSSSKSKSEEMLAAQKAFSMALNMPMSGSLSTVLSGGTQVQMSSSSIAMAGGTISVIEESPATTSQALKQTQQLSNQEPSSQKGAPSIPNKPRSTQKKPPSQAKPSICPNPLIKAAAFAAGGRIATPSTAASLFKAAQSRNVVRIRHGAITSLAGSSLASTTVITSPSSTSTAPAAAPTPPRLCYVKGGSGKASRLPPSKSMPHLPSEANKLGVSLKRRHSIIISDVEVDELLAEEGRGAPGKETRAIDAGDPSRAHGREASESLCIENVFMQSKDFKVEQSSEGNGGGEEGME